MSNSIKHTCALLLAGIFLTCWLASAAEQQSEKSATPPADDKAQPKPKSEIALVVTGMQKGEKPGTLLITYQIQNQSKEQDYIIYSSVKQVKETIETTTDGNMTKTFKRKDVQVLPSRMQTTIRGRVGNALASSFSPLSFKLPGNEVTIPKGKAYQGQATIDIGDLDPTTISVTLLLELPSPDTSTKQPAGKKFYAGTLQSAEAKFSGFAKKKEAKNGAE